jgi:hypothetical protein
MQIPVTCEFQGQVIKVAGGYSASQSWVASLYKLTVLADMFLSPEPPLFYNQS